MPKRSVMSLPLLAVPLLAVSFCSFAALCVLQRAPMADLLVYRAEGTAVSHGSDLYGFTVTEWRLPATYPPFAAVLFVPTTWIPVPALKAAFLAVNALLLTGLVALSARLASRTLPLPVLCTATALAVWLEPVFQTLLFGQINLAVTCLVLWDLTRPPRTRPAVRPTGRATGLALGLAAGIKLTPAIFIAYLFLRGRRREAATATAAFLGTVLLGAVLLPSATAEFWTARLYDTGRVGKAWIVDNQSLQGMIARALHDPAPGLAWAVPAAAVGTAGLWLAVRAGARAERYGVLLTALTALLVSPISWSHHWVWCVPFLAVLLAEDRVRLAALTAALFTARTLWLVPHEGDRDLRLPWWEQPLASPYPLLGLALLGTATFVTQRSRRIPAGAAQPSERISSASTIR
ncbi:glycosyltransferase 87 family protein [Streptomyces sp. NPDC048297]|uniref:glycosyltransferase 87 family protein n=1 Tax=Streptomyces sp. NPDC048297 TaxID=3365531 RepID=UPI003721F2B5